MRVPVIQPSLYSQISQLDRGRLLALRIGTRATTQLRDKRLLRLFSPTSRPARPFLPRRIEMGYSYDVLAQVSGKPMPDAARKATARALVRVAGTIARASE